jgi:hypothetical protein
MFQEYIDEVKKNLHEDSIKHILQQMGYEPSEKDRQVNICLISANRSELTPEENNKALKNLKRDLAGLGFDHIQDLNVDKDQRPYPYSKTGGGWTDFARDGIQEEEPSLKVVDIYDDFETFEKKMAYLGQKYGQWDVLIKPKGSKQAYYLVTTAHPADSDEDHEGDWNVGDKHRFFNNATKADPTVDPYWTRHKNQYMKLEQALTITEEELDALYNVPYSKWGRNYPTYTAAHSASIARKNLNLPDFPMGFHPYGEKWTAKAISDAHQKD